MTMTRSNFPKQVTPAMARTRNPNRGKSVPKGMGKSAPPKKERKC